jgi:electron transfer flavoprotein beta subunit
MNIVVFVKEVPDTESRIRVKGGAVDLSEVKFIAGPYDEYAVEEALRIRDAAGGKVTLICYGEQRAGKTLNSELAKGADELILVDEYIPDADPLAVGELLARMAQKTGYDLILCGYKGTDMDNACAGIIAAQRLGLPHVAYAVKIELAPDLKSTTVHRAVEGSIEVCYVPLPAVITCQKGLNEPRYAKLTGIMQAKKKPHHEKKLADYGLNPAEMRSRSKVEYTAFLPPPTKEPGKILEGDDAAKVQQLIKHLVEDEKVL